MKAWSRATIDRIATSWEKLLTLKEETESLKELELGYLLIQTRSLKEIDEIIDLNFESRYFSVRVREVIFDDAELEECLWNKMIEEDLSPEKLSSRSPHNLNGSSSYDSVLGNDDGNLAADVGVKIVYVKSP